MCSSKSNLNFHNKLNLYDYDDNDNKQSAGKPVERTIAILRILRPNADLDRPDLVFLWIEDDEEEEGK